MAGERFRNPPSTAISFSSWEPVAATVLSGKRRAVPGSKGKVVIKFRRNPGKYTYPLTRLFTLEEWLSWMKTRSVGRRWNFQYIGRV